MPGLIDLHAILSVLQPQVRPGRFVVVTTTEPTSLPAAARIVEDEGVTLVLQQAVADGMGLDYEGVFGWITLTAHTSLQAVGVTAAVASALAKVGISGNVLAGFHHDHLLVPVDQVDDAVDVLGGLG